MKLNAVAPHDLSEHEIELLLAAAKRGYNNITARDILFTLDIKLYRYGESLVGTQVIEWPQGNELNIFLVVGQGFVETFTEVYELLEAKAIAQNCRWITCHATRPGIVKLAESVGAKQHAVVCVKELDYVA